MIVNVDRFGSAYARKLGSIAAQERKAFVGLIERAQGESIDDLDWFVSYPASRNTHISNLYSRVLGIRLVDELLDAGGVHELITKSPAMRKVLKDLCRRRGAKVVVRDSILSRLTYVGSSIVKAYLRLLVNCVTFASRHLCAILTREPRRGLRNDTEALTIVSTYVYPSSFTGTQFSDRHYPGLLESATVQQKRQIRLIPMFYNVKVSLKLFQLLRSHKPTFLIKEDYLRISDYAYAIMHGFRVSKYRAPTVLYRGMDLSSLINEEMYGSRFRTISLEGILNFRFIKRLYDEGTKVEILVDWYENQSHTRGTALAVNKFYPHASFKGYWGCPPMPDYQCLYPTRREVAAGVVPSTIVVVGKAYVDSLRDFCDDLRVVTGPALRFVHLWRDSRNAPVTGRRTVLIALAAIPETCLSILSITAGVLSASSMKVMVRKHPSMPIAQCQRILRRAAPALEYELSEGPFDQALSDASLFVSSASGTCLESVVTGISTIVVGSESGLSYSPVPREVPESICCTCYTADEFGLASSRFLEYDEKKREEIRAYGGRLRKDYFEEVTLQSIVTMLSR